MTGPKRYPRRRSWSLVLLRGDGRPAWSVEVSTHAARAAQALLPLLFAFGVWNGWLMHGQHVRGAQTDYQMHTARDGGHWTHFTSAGEPVPTEHVRMQKRRAAMVYALRLGLGSVQAAGKMLAGILQQRWIDAANRGREGDGTLLWPVPTGWFVRGYGSGEEGYHLAVDIMGERGTDVLAAAPGIVGYAGDGVRGYGNLLVLVHPGARVSVYAHNQKTYVVPGERVRRGQPIAALGNTGISRGPHVHFEFIHGGKNCDPLPLFRPGIRHRAGHLSPIDPVVWPIDGQRPRDVRCAPRRRHPHSRWYDEHGHGDATDDDDIELAPPPPARPTAAVELAPAPTGPAAEVELAPAPTTGPTARIELAPAPTTGPTAQVELAPPLPTKPAAVAAR